MVGSTSDAAFQWGNREAGFTSSYESMFYRGDWYRLHDCVFCRSGLSVPYVGKLMRLFEEDGVKKVRIRWFMRPYELPADLLMDLPRDVLSSKELFIAIGATKGVENENEVDTILKKACVLCTARIGNNPIPSQALVDNADHFFSRAFDAVENKLVKLVTIRNPVLVQKFFNKIEWVRTTENAQVGDARASTSEGSTSSITSKDVNLVRKKHSLSRTSEPIVTKAKKLKKF